MPNYTSSTENSASWGMNSSFIQDLTTLNNPKETARYTCDRMRTLTGAKSVSFFLHTEDQTACRPIYVCPEQQNNQIINLCLVCLPEQIALKVDDIPEGNPLGRKLKESRVDNLLRIPVGAGDHLAGTLVIMDIPDITRSDDIFRLMDIIGPSLGLAIRHSLAQQELEQQREQLEELVKKRTAELEAANQGLAESRKAALNMMEDAILDKERLKQSETKWRRYIESAPYGIFIADESGRCLSANPSAEKITGFSREEILEMSFRDFLPEPDREKGWAQFQTLNETGKSNADLNFIHKNGETRWWNVSAVKLNDNQYICFTQDISDRIEADKKIEDQARFPQENINPVMRISSNGMLIYGNKASRKLHPALFIPNTTRLTEHWIKQINDSFERNQLLENNLSVDDEVFSATAVPVKAHGYLNIYAHNITHRLKAEQRVAESHNRFSTLISNLPGMAYRCGNKVDWSMEFVSSGSLALTGYTAEELTKTNGVTYGDLIHPDDRQQVWKKVQTSLAQKKHYEIEYRIIHRDGSKRWVWERGIEVESSREKPNILEGFIADITERKQAEIALRMSQEQWRTTLNSIGDALITTDTSGRIVNMNPVAENLTGWEIADAVDLPLLQVFRIVQEDSRKPIKDPAQLILKSNTIVTLVDSALLISKNRNEIPISHNSTPIRRDDGTITGVVLVFSDQTKERNAHRRLEESQRLLRSIIDTLPSHVWWKGLNCKFLGSNIHYAHDMDQESPDALVGKSNDDLFSKEWAERYTADEQEVLQSGEPQLDVQELVTLSNGTTRWVETNKVPLRDAEGRIIGTVGTSTDITERKRYEEEHLRLSTAVEQSPETILITDEEGTIQYANPAFESISGYSREEVLGNNPRILKSNEHDDAFYSNLWNSITSGQVWEGRLTNKRKDGSLFTEEASIAPIRDAQGMITNYVAVKRDITEELIREQEFRQSQKMEAIGLLAGGIAHDFNNILQGIMGFSTMLMNKLEPTTRQHEQAHEIHKASIRAAELTQHLLAFSRKQPVNTSRQNVNEIVNEMYALLEILLGENIEMKLNLDNSLHTLRGDHGQISQIIMNLAVNARDAMPMGGCLSISTGNGFFSAEEAATIQGAKPGDHICLSIADNGVGMNQKTLEHLFEPFFTTKKVGKGSGLGLSVVYGIVKQNEGWIQVHSEAGQGSDFRIYFPASADAASTSARQEPGKKPLTRILLVEDDKSVQNMTKTILQTVQFVVSATDTAEEGQELFERKDAAFDLLISDLQLPGKNGNDLADLLTDKHPDLPVLLYSGYKDKVILRDSLREKGYHFIEKPFKIMGLLAAVQEALDFKDKEN